MNILINNYHVAYIYLLAKTGHNIFVVNPPSRPCWDLRQRPLPPNVILIDNVENIMKLLYAGKEVIDRVIMQDMVIQGSDGKPDFADRLLFSGLDCQKVMLFHNSFQTQFRSVPTNMFPMIKFELETKLKGIKKVFISKMKKESYGMEGDIILPAIDENEFGGWDGKGNYILTCCNNFQSRDFMNNFRFSSAVTSNINKKYIVLGEEGERRNLAPNFDALKQAYKGALSYLALNNYAFEDGYNLSMLEAMMCGCPAITLDVPSSPIKNGYNGFKSNDLNQLNKYIKQMDYSTAFALSKGARETVKEMFPLEAFVKNWNSALDMP